MSGKTIVALLALACALIGAAWWLSTRATPEAPRTVTSPVRSGYDILNRTLEAEADSVALDSATVARLNALDVEAARLAAAAAGHARGFREGWAAVPRLSEAALARAQRLPLDTLAIEVTDSLSTDR